MVLYLSSSQSSLSLTAAFSLLRWQVGVGDMYCSGSTKKLKVFHWTLNEIQPSIHPLSYTYSTHFIAEIAGLEGYSRYPSPQELSPALPGGSWGIPRPDEICCIIHLGGFWVCHKIYSQLVMLVNLQGEALRRHPHKMPEPPQLAPFNAKEERLYPQLSTDVWCLTHL